MIYERSFPRATFYAVSSGREIQSERRGMSVAAPGRRVISKGKHRDEKSAKGFSSRAGDAGGGANSHPPVNQLDLKQARALEPVFSIRAGLFTADRSLAFTAGDGSNLRPALLKSLPLLKRACVVPDHMFALRSWTIFRDTESAMAMVLLASRVFFFP